MCGDTSVPEDGRTCERVFCYVGLIFSVLSLLFVKSLLMWIITVTIYIITCTDHLHPSSLSSPRVFGLGTHIPRTGASVLSTLPYILAYKPTIFGSISTFKLWGSAYTRVMPHIQSRQSAWRLSVSDAHCVCAANGVDH